MAVESCEKAVSYGSAPLPEKCYSFYPPEKLELFYLPIITLIMREIRRNIRFFGLITAGPALRVLLFCLILSLAASGTKITMLGLDHLAFIAPGLLVTAILERAFETTAHSLMFDKTEVKVITDILSAPVAVLMIVFSYIVAAIFMALLIGLSIWVIMLPFGIDLPLYPGWFLIFTIIGCIAFSCFGMSAALISAKWDSLTGWEIFIMAPAIFLSGSFFPVHYLHDDIWQLLIKFNPVYYLVDGVRWAFTGQAENDLFLSLLVAVGTAFFSFILAFFIFKRGYGVKP